MYRHDEKAVFDHDTVKILLLGFCDNCATKKLINLHKGLHLIWFSQIDEKYFIMHPTDVRIFAS